MLAKEQFNSTEKCLSVVLSATFLCRFLWLKESNSEVNKMQNYRQLRPP
ncbi:MAG: hypothetical protein IJR66_00110 [Clostridia bacterium]|nr:hypothetical protein [Clostridia bacterium]